VGCSPIDLDQGTKNPSYLSMPIDPEKLLLDVKGATAEELDRGLAAAFAVFDRAGTTPCEAAVARFKRDGETEDLTDREAEIADLWEIADEAAIRAYCSGWAEIPSDAQIMLAQK
jgi:HEAT repeat protein